MTNELKQNLLVFLHTNNDGTDECKQMIEELTRETEYADMPYMGLCPKDLNAYEEDVREILDKPKGDFTLDDCEKIANIVDDYIQDGDYFGEMISNALWCEICNKK